MGPGWSSPWNHGISRKGARIELALEPQHLKKREPDAASCSGTKECQEKGLALRILFGMGDAMHGLAMDDFGICFEFSNQLPPPLKGDH